jgi:hypothetical protein
MRLQRQSALAGRQSGPQRRSHAIAVPVRDEIELVGRGASIAPGSGFSRNPREIQTPSRNLVFRTSAIAAKKVIATLSVFRSSQT